MVKSFFVKGLGKLAGVMIGKNFSSMIVIVCGIVGLISILLPWEVLSLRYMGEREGVGYFSLIELWTLDPSLNEMYWYWILALLPISFILCVVTPFLTRRGEKTSIRAPLYVFYGFVAALTLLAFHSWVERPVGTVPELHISSYVGLGFSVSAITIIGILVAAFVSLLESRPRFSSRSALLIGVISGTIVELSFFCLDWVTAWHWYEWMDGLFSTGRTGFQIAIYDNFWTAFDIVGLDIFRLRSVSLMLGLLVPLALYIVPMVGAFAIISPFLNAKLGSRNVNVGRVARVGSGGALLAVALFFLTEGKFSSPYYNGSGYMAAFGMWLTAATGLFLIISEVLLHLKRRCTSDKQTISKN